MPWLYGGNVAICDGCGWQVIAEVPNRKHKNLCEAGGYIKAVEGVWRCACPLCLLDRKVWPQDQCDDFWDFPYAMGSDRSVRLQRRHDHWNPPMAPIQLVQEERGQATQPPAACTDGEQRSDSGPAVSGGSHEVGFEDVLDGRHHTALHSSVPVGVPAASSAPEPDVRTSWAATESVSRSGQTSSGPCCTGPPASTPAMPRTASDQAVKQEQEQSSGSLRDPPDGEGAPGGVAGACGQQLEETRTEVSADRFGIVLGGVVDSVHMNREDICGILARLECLQAQVQQHTEQLQHLQGMQSNSSPAKPRFQ